VMPNEVFPIIPTKGVFRMGIRDFNGEGRREGDNKKPRKKKSETSVQFTIWISQKRKLWGFKEKRLTSFPSGGARHRKERGEATDGLAGGKGLETRKSLESWGGKKKPGLEGTFVLKVHGRLPGGTKS